ncbi:MAG: DUF5652 family protein [bacterium]
MSPFINENPMVLLILVLWTLPWKIFALWTAVKNNHKGWFIALVILNTFGIVEIIYIFVVAKKKWSDIKRTLLNILSSKK